VRAGSAARPIRRVVVVVAVVVVANFDTVRPARPANGELPAISLRTETLLILLPPVKPDVALVMIAMMIAAATRDRAARAAVAPLPASVGGNDLLLLAVVGIS
jgi:hypothetical protein